ncbi:MAG: hypothetical protein IAF38_08600 [Bacteroidia bacterium]|nr:hypothetical protein [Bacteroidia bacterium]
MKFRKNIILKAVLLLLIGFSFEKADAQRLFKDGPKDKYFVAMAYGIGNANWFSKLEQSALYDTSGAEMFSGKVNFKARNTTKCVNVDVSAPVMNVRLGMGLCFEEFYIEKLKINSTQYYFEEKFRFEKMYAQIEIPIQRLSNDYFTFNLKSQAGYFGYSYVNHINFLGMDNKASVLFMNTGFIADYKLYPHTYAYIHPTFEYKYFRNAASEAPARIVHNIFSYGVMFGIRIDVSRE